MCWGAGGGGVDKTTSPLSIKVRIRRAQFNSQPRSEPETPARWVTNNASHGE